MKKLNNLLNWLAAHSFTYKVLSGSDLSAWAHEQSITHVVRVDTDYNGLYAPKWVYDKHVMIEKYCNRAKVKYEHQAMYVCANIIIYA